MGVCNRCIHDFTVFDYCGIYHKDKSLQFFIMGNIKRLKMRHRIAQIIPYFGKWPEWIELYFYSCGRNPMIDFIFYTDCPLPMHRYANTIFHHCSYEDYCQLVSKRLGIDFHVRNPYKLTDLKPFMGIIHKEELKGYDFWGFGDLDLVYGNLTMIVNEENLNRYELITTHNYHIAGHFTICRNNEKWRNMCFKIPDWKSKLQSEKALSMDELDFTYVIHPAIRWISRIHKYLFKPLGVHYFKVLDALNPIFAPKLHLKEYWTSPQPKKGESWTYENIEGRIVDYIGRELPYLHFLFFKKTPWLDTNDYWRAGYWKVNENVECCDKVVFNIKEVVSQ